MPFLAFDGEIKDWVTPKSGPGTPNPIALSSTQCRENKELALWQRRKNVWLGLTAVKLAQEWVLFYTSERLASGCSQFVRCSQFHQRVAAIPHKTHLHTQAFHSLASNPESSQQIKFHFKRKHGENNCTEN